MGACKSRVGGVSGREGGRWSWREWLACKCGVLVAACLSGSVFFFPSLLADLGMFVVLQLDSAWSDYEMC